MLDSLERGPLPTRAEVTDVFFAVENGSDCTMLSGETAQGLYPVEAVGVMSKILQKSEQNYDYAYAITKDFPLSKLAKSHEGIQLRPIILQLLKSYREKAPNEPAIPSYLIVFTNNPDLVNALSSSRLFANLLIVTDKISIHRGFGLHYGVYTKFVDSLDLTREERNETVQEIVDTLPKGTAYSVLYRKWFQLKKGKLLK
ncbi:unnamed protein product [Didymodactylos carnosus]|uniref:Pyruvate kinase n=1 Tax=Didymodactylos carnosus TaxID=1234261 RepID=A0A8S2GF40_9BILA|nr:unnamed protein product [Didymodactylos carnosus]CAF3491645.1 unnamed protein product [Didymodactylos carnosus]